MTARQPDQKQPAETEPAADAVRPYGERAGAAEIERRKRDEILRHKANAKQRSAQALERLADLSRQMGEEL